MAFDAGAISASLTVDTSAFDRALDAAKAKVDAFEKERHEVKLSAVFDSSSVSKARQQFAQLDQTISKDAMSRLRSSPQGSVLGALNALFSPHQVTGAPSAQQAAQQGLLGKMISGQGGGIGQTINKQNVIKEVIGVDDDAAKAAGAKAGKDAADAAADSAAAEAKKRGGIGALISRVLPGATGGAPTPAAAVQQVMTGQGAGNTTTTDTIKQQLSGQGAQDVTTTDTIRQNLTGQGPRDTTTTDTVKEKLDTSSATKTESDAKDSGDRAGKNWASSFSSHLTSLFSGIFGKGGSGSGGAGGAGSAGSAAGGSFGAKLFDAIGPGILGTSFKTASILGLGGAALGGLPALAGGLAPLGIAGAGAGVLAGGFAGVQSQVSPVSTAYAAAQAAQQKATTPAQLQAAAQQMAAVNKQIAALSPALQSIFKSEQQIGDWWKKFTATLAPDFAGPLRQVASLLQGLTGPLNSLFGSAATLAQPLILGLGDLARTVLPLLGAAFRATAPFIRPLIDGISQLAGGLLSGLISLLKAAAPAVQVVAGFFASLGSNLGEMFRQFSTVLGPSSVILKALLGVVTGLLPVIGGLAQVMASALGPAFTAFAGAIRALEPFLVTVGKIIAQFAGAVLTDLSAGLQLVAGILKAVAPAFNTLATALGQVFNTLESKGAFAQLGNILEGLAAPIGTLISKLIDGLAPAIPPLLTLFGDFVNVISTVGVHVLTALIPPLTQLAETALGAIIKVLPLVIPVLTQFLGAFTTDAGNLIASIGGSLLNLANVVLTALLKAAAPLIPVVLGLLSALTPLLNVFTAATAAVITAVANALAAVVNAIPSGVLTAVIAGVAGVVGGMKLWAGATGAVATALKAVTGSSIVSWLSGAIGSVTTFAAATEGATLAEKGMLAAELAFDAVSPFVWIGAAVAGLGALTAALVLTKVNSTTVIGEFQQQQAQLGYNISGYQKLAAGLDQASAGFEHFAQTNTDAVRGGAAAMNSLSQQTSAIATQVSQAAKDMESRLTSLSTNLGVSKTTIEQWASAAGISATKFSSAGENVGQLSGQIVAFVNKNAEAITSTATLGTNVSIFGSDVFNTTTQLDAFNGIWNTLVGNLLTKQQAVTQGQQSFDNLKQSIKDNGSAATATTQSFQAYISQIGSSVDTLLKGGTSISGVNGYLQTQISHLSSLGPLNKGEAQDLDNLRALQDTLANSTHGLNSEQQTLISQFQHGLIPSLQQIGANTPTVNTDIKNLADSIIQTGNNSASTAGDRAKLIADLKQTGLSSQQSQQFVKNLQGQIDGLKGKVVSVGVTVSAAGKAAATALVSGEAALHDSITFQTQGAAAGGLITGGTPGKDSVLGMLMPGEVVVPTAMVQAGAVDHLRGQLPGFAAGGQVSLGPLVNWASSADADWGNKASVAWAQAALAQYQASLKKAALAGTPVAYSKIAGVTQWEGDVARVLSMLGLPQADMPTVMEQIQTECVTIDTMILTRRGWLDYTEVQPGDETVGYNPASGHSEWTRIERVVFYPQREVSRFGNKYWSVKCTPNHRWLAEQVVRRCVTDDSQDGVTCPECGATGSSRGSFKTWRAVQIHRARTHGTSGNYSSGVPTTEVSAGFMLRELSELRPHDRIVLARPAESGTELNITVSEAALLGWIAGDGWVNEDKDYWAPRKTVPAPKPPDENAPFGYRRDGQPRKNRSGRPLATGPVRVRSSFAFNVCQAKSEYFTAIDAACSADPDLSVIDTPGRKRGYRAIRTWRLSTAYSRDLLARAGNPKTDAVSQILRMSPPQREAWLEAMIAAEGHRSSTKTVVYQNDGPVADAIELAIYLSGNRPARTKTHSGSWGIGITAAYVGGPSRRIFREPAGHQDVWCVTTGLGTWTAKQDGHVFLTGNSGGNPNAINNYDINAQNGDPSRGLMQVIGATFAAYRNPSLSSNIYDPLANIYAGLNYAVHRYGNPGWLGVLGHGHGYALGGMVPGGESYGMYGNGGMISEPVIGYGVNSGKGYVLGESGREQVTPASEVQRQASLQTAMLTELRQQTQVLKQIPAGVGQHVGGAINGAAHDASFRARYQRGGY